MTTLRSPSPQEVVEVGVPTPDSRNPTVGASKASASPGSDNREAIETADPKPRKNMRKATTTTATVGPLIRFLNGFYCERKSFGVETQLGT